MNHKITDIQIKKNNIKRRIIYIDHQSPIEIDDTIISDLDLYIGKTINEHIIVLIQQKEIISKAKNDAILFLSYRFRSEREIVNKLQKRKYNQNTIKKTLQWLKEKNLVNDKEFSLMWIKDRLRNRPLGKLKLRKELYSKGIDKDIIENTVNIFFKNEDDELKLAYQLVRIKKDSLKLKNISLEPKNIISLLKSRGFSYSVIDCIYKELFFD